MWPRYWSSDVCSSDLFGLIFSQFLGLVSQVRGGTDVAWQIAKLPCQGYAVGHGGAGLQARFGGFYLVVFLAAKRDFVGSEMRFGRRRFKAGKPVVQRSEEHTSELQSRGQLVCRLLLEKKKTR